MKKLRLGIIGANANRGWAQKAHVPALAVLGEFELTAVCTTRQDSAEASAHKFGALRAYDDVEKLVADLDIEAVAVVVRIDRHYAPVMAALRARKHILCEWPLGHSTWEAEAMTRHAVEQGVVHQVGFQTRRNVYVRQMQELVRQGFIGRLRSITMAATTSNWGAEISADAIYGADEKIGVNIFNIQGGHALDLLCHCFGSFAHLNATMANLRRETRVAETGEIVPFTSPDQLIVNGTLKNGAVVSMHLQSGALHNQGFRMVVRGDEGELVLASDDVVPTGTLRLEGARRGDSGPVDLNDIVPLPTLEPELAGLPQVIASIAESYHSFGAAIRSGQRASPSFAEALDRHRLLDAVARASASGERQSISSD
jgi:predicted dehydrogenase